MFKNSLYNFPLDKVLDALGAKRGKQKNMWFSPLREETKASFHVDTVNNVWFDHGFGKGGTNVDLIMAVKNCSQKAAYSFIRELNPLETNTFNQSKTQRRCTHSTATENKPKSDVYIKLIRSIKNSWLVRNLNTRGIPLDIAQLYLKEVIVVNPNYNMQITLFGFPNNSKGYAMSNPSGFKYSYRPDITTINSHGELDQKAGCDTVMVFEGFFDYLSWLVMNERTQPPCDVVVLNSVTNLKKALDYLGGHQRILGYLDNDAAGRRCLQQIYENFTDREVADCSVNYKEYKDLNEKLQGVRHVYERRLTPNI